jgi:predicted AlkP superfamily pyrophosphatase or phosphodiesterase
MINDESLAAVAAARVNDQFLHPRYDAYGFAAMPQTLRRLLLDAKAGGVSFGPRHDLYQAYDTVILVFVDAFGWRFFEPWADHPFLQRIVHDGVVTKLTSQFPSTTAAHVTTIHTGLPVAQSGMYEWFFYEPQLDAIIAPLLFSFAGDTERDTLAQTGIAPAALYPQHTLYHEFRSHGVRSWVFQPLSFADSPFSRTVTNGATMVPYRTVPEALVNLARLITQQQERAYYFLYTDTVDTICHRYGPESAQVAAEIGTLLDTLERVLHPALAQAHGRTLLLLTADHGQTAIDPHTTVYLNRSLPQIGSWLKTSRAGKPLVPAGSSRDLFLHIKNDYVDEAHAALEAHLRGKADVRRVGDLINDHYFGPSPVSSVFHKRVGDLVVLPHRNESVWWYEQDRLEQVFRGNHGGLSGDEMETLLGALPYG